MSLLRRIQGSKDENLLSEREKRIHELNKPKQILESLLTKLYPDKTQLKLVVEEIIQNIFRLTDVEQQALSSNPIEFGIYPPPKRLTSPIRILLEQLHAERKLLDQVQIIITEENITLSDNVKTFIKAHLIDYLMGTMPPTYYVESSLADPNDSQLIILKAATHRILSDKRITEMIDEYMKNKSNPREIFEEVFEEVFNKYLEEQAITLSDPESKQFIDLIFDQVFGFGQLEPLLADKSISQIYINGPFDVSIMRNGKREKANTRFANPNELWTIIDRFSMRYGGIRIDSSEPITQFQTPDGYLVTFVHDSIADHGPIIIIYKPNT